MNFEELLTWLQKRKGCKLGQGATDQEIKEAERSLGIRFPEEYTEFLRRAGWLDWGYAPLFGLGTDTPSFLNLVNITLEERHKYEPNIPTYLLPIMNDGAGNHYCFFVEGPNTGKICFWDHEHEDAEKQVPEVVGSSFVDWLSNYVSDLPND